MFGVPVVMLSFGAFLLMFTLIGVAAMLQKSNTTEDYLVAGRSVPWWLTALSTLATAYSGYMFFGLIGCSYRVGFLAIWLSIGNLLGDLSAWYWINARIRRHSEKIKAKSVPTLLGTRLDGSISRPIRVTNAMPANIAPRPTGVKSNN